MTKQKRKVAFAALLDEFTKIADMLTPKAFGMVRAAAGQMTHAQPQTGRALHLLAGSAGKAAPAMAAAPAKKTFDMGAYRAAKASQGAYRGLGQNARAVVG